MLDSALRTVLGRKPEAPRKDDGPHVDSERVACNLCGSSDERVLYVGEDFRFETDERAWPVVQCRRCGLAYLNPRPTADTIGSYYPKRFHSGREVEHLKSRYELQASYLAGRTGRLLDIGCSQGDWTAMMADRGWDVVGLEPSPDCANPHGLTVHRSGFPDAGVVDGPFDAISAWAVFEHLHDPMAAFRRCAELLAPSGTLLIIVPNIRSVASRFTFRDDVPRHLYFFSEQTLSAYASKTGLRLRRVDHVPHLFGGAGRGAIGVHLITKLGWSRRDYFRFTRMSRRERFATNAPMAAVYTAIGGVERVVLSDALARMMRASGHIVAELTKA